MNDTMTSFSYKLIPSSSGSSPDTSHCSLSCDFDQLAGAYPEFSQALEDLRRRRYEYDNNSNIAKKQKNQNDYVKSREKDEKKIVPISLNTLSSHVNHSFNASLTRALLHIHFGLHLPSLPEGRLVPPVPNRCNYVAWLKQVLLSSFTDLNRFCNARDSSCELQHKGIDIGTGVSAIYPLLLTTKLFANCNELKCKTHSTKSWQFLATDIDPISIESASKNIQANNLQDEIHVAFVEKSSFKSTPDNVIRGPLFAAMEAAKTVSSMFQQENGASKQNEHNEYPKFDFVMTNPPFYSSLEELTAPRAGDKRCRTDISVNEGVYHCEVISSEGGEVGFVDSIIRDSWFFRNHVTWFTSLIAKRSSLDLIHKKLLQVEGIWGNRGQIRTVEFHQDNINGDRKKTQRNPRVRWGIAWTYERAVGRCCSCRVRSGLQSFDVSLPVSCDERKQVVDEVSSRLIAYFSEVREIYLRCIDMPRERSSGGKANCKERCISVTEERFSAFISQQEQGNGNLPDEGHFIIDVFVAVKDENQSKNGVINVDVSLEMYAHTTHGMLLLDKIRGQMPGEIGRTNRRWRRILKRQSVSSNPYTPVNEP